MPKTLRREPQKFTVAECCSEDAGLPEKLELWNGVIGPFSDRGKLSLLANWGADDVVRLTGPEIWREAIAALGQS
jgi:hypothetical protein